MHNICVTLIPSCIELVQINAALFRQHFYDGPPERDETYQMYSSTSQEKTLPLRPLHILYSDNIFFTNLRLVVTEWQKVRCSEDISVEKIPV